MNNKNNDVVVTAPKNQRSLYGYEKHFHSFVKLFEGGKIPNCVLLSGPKGLGKSTFVYHFINFILSKNQEKKYDIKDFYIDHNNLSYKLLEANTHPNFFLVENHPLEKEIKIEQIRNLLKFLSKTTYSKEFKIIMIDNIENLNLNSSNALLKAIEEPKNNTFFFIIHNNEYKILETVKSRCVEFKFFFTEDEKRDIFNNLIKQYKLKINPDNRLINFYFDTPGNIIKYFLSLNKENVDVKEQYLESIFFFIEKYKKEKKHETLSFISYFIGKFYNDLCLNKDINLNSYFFNYTKILRLIDNLRRFNLDEKNIFISIKEILINETK